MVHEELQALVDEYKARCHEMTQKDLARIEDRVRRIVMHGDVLQKGDSTRDWMCEMLGVGLNKLSARAAIWRASEVSNVLFDRMDAGMPFNTVYEAFMAAKSLARNGKTLVQAVDDVLAQYDHGAVKLFSKKRKLEARSPPREPKLVSLVWDAVLPIVTSAISGLDEVDQHLVVKDLRIDMSVLFDEVEREVVRRRKNGRGLVVVKHVGPGALRSACMVLGVDPPKHGEPLDMAMVKRQFRKHMKTCHPDSHNGDRKYEVRYAALQDALRKIQDYMEELVK